jgi:hypothetical protein
MERSGFGRDTAQAMSEETLETFRSSLEAFDRRDRDAWLAFRDQDYEVIPVADWPETDIRGRDAAWDFYVEVLGAFQQSRVSEDTELLDAAPDKVLMHYRGDLPVGKAGLMSGSTTGSSPLSVEAKSFATTGSPTGPRPSKPPGCGK